MFRYMIRDKSIDSCMSIDHTDKQGNLGKSCKLVGKSIGDPNVSFKSVNNFLTRDTYPISESYP